MPTKQRFVVTALICFGMATIMSLIGNLLATGWRAVTFQNWLIWWLPTVLAAFLYNWFVPYRITEYFIRRATRRLTDPAAIAARTLGVRGRVMLVVMCLSMSTYGLFIGGAFLHIDWEILLWVWVRSLIIAFIIRGLIVKPAAFFLTRKILSTV
ncbi:hypothetical protein [Schleiferilactobacillus harbinensis]|uniref:hypothetical protein n=1 Tax=Schleiferilactobacillus harbinensis TaxID=304207 RepID=UPI00116872F9|nr:hypothetical protein [Schleiferilactobacillus harbinensis]GEK06245.1 hypothetical protein LHA01_14840 [Schleiferilactobacillus harbinensis]